MIASLADRGTAVVLSSHRMDDVADLCSEVTLLATGRVVFSGPLEKLAAETGELDYRLRTTDPCTARCIVGQTPGMSLSVGREPHQRHDDDLLVVVGPVQGLDELVVRLVGAGVGIRELGPVVSPLESAFLALTGEENEPAIRLDGGMVR